MAQIAVEIHFNAPCAEPDLSPTIATYVAGVLRDAGETEAVRRSDPVVLEITTNAVGPLVAGGVPSTGLHVGRAFPHALTPVRPIFGAEEHALVAAARAAGFAVEDTRG